GRRGDHSHGERRPKSGGGDRLRISRRAGPNQESEDRDPGPPGRLRESMTNDEGQRDGSLLALALLALVAGVLVGIVGAIFRLSLEQADHLRDALISWAHGREAGGFLFVLAACAAASAFAAWLVRR